MNIKYLVCWKHSNAIYGYPDQAALKKDYEINGDFKYMFNVFELDVDSGIFCMLNEYSQQRIFKTKEGTGFFDSIFGPNMPKKRTKK